VRRLSGLRVFFGYFREPGQIGEPQRMKRRTWRKGEGSISASLGEQASAERDAALSLAPPGSEAGVPLERFDVVMTARDGLLELVERHVFASTDEDLGHRGSSDQLPSYSQRASQVSKTVTRTSDGRCTFIRSQIHLATTSLVGFSRPSTSLR